MKFMTVLLGYLLHVWIINKHGNNFDTEYNHWTFLYEWVEEGVKILHRQYFSF